MVRAFTRRDVTLWLALFALGAIFGSALAVVRLGNEVDRLTLDNVYLMDQIERLSNRITLLDTYGPASGAYVEAIEVTAHGIDRARPGLEQALKELLGHLVGEELERVNAATIHSTLERNITWERQEYAVTVRYVYITPTVRVHVDVRPEGEPDLIE